MRQEIKISAFGYVWGDARAPIASSPDFVTFTVGVTEKYPNKITGEEQKNFNWIECKCNNPKLNSTILNYVKDGRKIFVEGFASTSAYLDKNNEPKGKIILKIKSYNLLGDKTPDKVVEDNEERFR